MFEMKTQVTQSRDEFHVESRVRPCHGETTVLRNPPQRADEKHCKRGLHMRVCLAPTSRTSMDPSDEH